MSHVFTSRPAARFRAVLLFFCVVVSALSFSMQALYAQSPSLIDANAKLHIVVANEAQLTGDYTVDSAGNITMLYINQVHVQGLTPAQAAAAIRGEAAGPGQAATGLTKYYVSPQVVVTITDTGGIGVDVTGLVSAPRHYVLPSNAHLNDLMVLAVPSLNSDLSKVLITHSDTSTQDTVDYRAYLDNKVETGNPPLRSGDVINVSTSEPLPIFVNVQGQVAKPGRFQVPAATTAYTAIQDAGGPTVSANLSQVVIKHFGVTNTLPFQYEQAGQSPTDVTLNPVLLDGDTIIVPAAAINSTYTITGPGVRNPSEYPLPNGAPITLASAIGKAGGLSDRAQIKAVQIIRTDPKTQAIQTIKLDATNPNVQGTYLVQPGDNITISQSNPPSKIDPFQILGIVIAVISIAHH
jgi:protein involved in polysaccharide export with SLBB domain